MEKITIDSEYNNPRYALPHEEETGKDDSTLGINLFKKSTIELVLCQLHVSSGSGNKGSALGCFLFRNVFTLLLFVIGASPSRYLAII